MTTNISIESNQEFPFEPDLLILTPPGQNASNASPSNDFQHLYHFLDQCYIDQFPNEPIVDQYTKPFVDAIGEKKLFNLKQVPIAQLHLTPYDCGIVKPDDLRGKSAVRFVTYDGRPGLAINIILKDMDHKELDRVTEVIIKLFPPNSKTDHTTLSYQEYTSVPFTYSQSGKQYLSQFCF